jgi:hypothetical protein
MPYHPDHVRPRRGRLIAIALLLAALAALYLWSLRGGRERVVEPVAPTGGAATTVGPPATPATAATPVTP